MERDCSTSMGTLHKARQEALSAAHMVQDYGLCPEAMQERSILVAGQPVSCHDFTTRLGRMDMVRQRVHNSPV